MLTNSFTRTTTKQNFCDWCNCAGADDLGLCPDCANERKVWNMDLDEIKFQHVALHSFLMQGMRVCTFDNAKFGIVTYYNSLQRRVTVKWDDGSISTVGKEEIIDVNHSCF